MKASEIFAAAKDFCTQRELAYAVLPQSKDKPEDKARVFIRDVRNASEQEFTQHIMSRDTFREVIGQARKRLNCGLQITSCLVGKKFPKAAEKSYQCLSAFRGVLRLAAEWARDLPEVVEMGGSGLGAAWGCGPAATLEEIVRLETYLVVVLWMTEEVDLYIKDVSCIQSAHLEIPS